MGLAYQYLADQYEGNTFWQSTGLALAGAIAGWGQSRYHRYLLMQMPEYLASRMQTFARKSRGKHRRDGVFAEARHRGRNWIPLWYVLGTAVLLGLSFLAAAWGSVYAVAAYLLPWAGFYCSRVYAWKELWRPAPIK